jgi:large subunit ribosomal protein L19|tara:strand:- start:995 stop:1375 length:381 start_codon:yes stop_codon:yes gene_type:complete
MNTIDNLTLDIFYKNENIPDVRLGDTIRVVSFLELPKEVAEGEKQAKERIQAFEGVIISKHNKISKINSTVTVRKMFQGGGVEKVFLLNSPWIKEIKIISRAKVKRAKLYYLRERTGKSARLKRSL